MIPDFKGLGLLVMVGLGTCVILGLGVVGAIGYVMFKGVQAVLS